MTLGKHTKKTEFIAKKSLTKRFTVSSFHSDFKGFLSLPSLFYLFQEVAWEHAAVNHFGYENLKEHGFFWVLSRVRVEIAKLPRWTEEFSIKTWPSGIEGAFALRDYLVTDGNGNKLVGATSSWLIVDIKSRRPQRPDTFFNRMPIQEKNRATTINAPRLSIPLDETILTNDVVSKISDIDVNQHVNNTRYIEWAINTFALEEYKNLNFKEIDINYLSESFCDEFSTVKRFNKNGNEYNIVITRQVDMKNLAVLKFLV
jgi:acyl-ACP thioesterase